MSLMFDSAHILSEDKSRKLFRNVLIFSQVVGVLAFICAAVWMGTFEDGGYAWNENPEKQFHYHPTFMTMGFIFLYGEALVVYRALRYEPKRITKLIHMAIHSMVIIFVIVALKAAWDSHDYHKDAQGNLDPLPNLMSLHSWIGITIVCAYFLQYATGFYTYFLPGTSLQTRQALMPFHQLFGVIIFVIVTINALVGISERAAWKHTCWTHDKEMCGKHFMSNMLGVCILLYSSSIVMIVMNPRWKRRPLPEEESLHRLSDFE
uniref:Cytochrome b561 domain-containing protein n=1 Tax=Rhabditophanes sp. KR3021 TaxID=114890 RepID=A0AC35TYW9_9BILA